MKAVKRALVGGTVVAWMFVAFHPWDRVSAGPPREAPTPTATADVTATVHESESLAVPTDLEIVGEYLVLVDRRADHPIHVLDAGSGELVRSFGREGDGPGEYRALRSVSAVPGSGSAFWAFDMRQSRLTYVDLADEAALERPWEADMVKLESTASVTGVEVDQDRNVVASGLFAEGRLALFAPDGRMLEAVGALTMSPEVEAPASVLQHAYMGKMEAHPDRTRLAIGLRHASRIEIRGTDGSLIAMTESAVEPFEPRFDTADTERGPVMRTDETLRFGYVDVAVTPSRIYGLYSGRTRAGNPGSANFGDQVHVFAWTGELLEVIKLDEDLIALAVEADGSTMYGVVHEPAPAVLSWSLANQPQLASPSPARASAQLLAEASLAE